MCFNCEKQNIYVDLNMFLLFKKKKLNGECLEPTVNSKEEDDESN